MSKGIHFYEMIMRAKLRKYKTHLYVKRFNLDFLSNLGKINQELVF
jgi:hypothetical protein